MARFLARHTILQRFRAIKRGRRGFCGARNLAPYETLIVQDRTGGRVFGLVAVNPRGEGTPPTKVQSRLPRGVRRGLIAPPFELALELTRRTARGSLVAIFRVQVLVPVFLP